MKKVLVFLLAVSLIFSSVGTFAYSVDDAFKDFKKSHSSFVSAVTGQGISEATLVDFLEDLYDYILEMHEVSAVTKSNFESKALTALNRVTAREKYHSLQDALLILYPDAVKKAVTDGVVAAEFKPLVETVKKIIFDNKMLGSSGNSGNSGNTGNTGNSSTVGGGTAGGTTSTTTPDTTSNFVDVSSSHWAYTAVSHLAKNFILNGYLDGSFRPDAYITRAEFAKIIVSATNSYDLDATSSFSDVSSDMWYYAYVSSAYKKGYITGYPDGTFNPNAYISRADICTIVKRCLSTTSVSTAPAFTDDSLIPEYAKEAVYALAAKGIVNGIGDGSFAPSLNATRAQTAKIVYQAVFAQ